MSYTTPTVLLSVAPNGDGDNYYENDARLHNGRTGSDARSHLLYGGSDWKHAALSAAGVARVLGVNVILNGTNTVTPDRLEAAVAGGREAFFEAVA